MKRYTHQALPPYTYVPGQQPHPRRDPEGHSYGLREPRVLDFAVAKWDACDTYLMAVDLFNCGYFWEAHEQWEAIWLALGRHGDVADLMKGLIKLAAAAVKHLEGRPMGVQRHAVRAAELFQNVGQSLREDRPRAPVELAGLQPMQLRGAAERIARDGWGGLELVLRMPTDVDSTE